MTTPSLIIADYLTGNFAEARGPLIAYDYADKLIRALSSDGWAITKVPDPRMPIEGAYGRDHPETSREAAKDRVLKCVFGDERCPYLLLLAAYGPMTCGYMADYLDQARNEGATRMKELRDELHLIEWVPGDETGKIARRRTGPRSSGLLHRVTPLGEVAAIREIQRGRDDGETIMPWMTGDAPLPAISTLGAHR